MGILIGCILTAMPLSSAQGQRQSHQLAGFVLAESNRSFRHDAFDRSNRLPSWCRAIYVRDG